MVRRRPTPFKKGEKNGRRAFTDPERGSDAVPSRPQVPDTAVNRPVDAGTVRRMSRTSALTPDEMPVTAMRNGLDEPAAGGYSRHTARTGTRPTDGRGSSVIGGARAHFGRNVALAVHSTPLMDALAGSNSPEAKSGLVPPCSKPDRAACWNGRVVSAVLPYSGGCVLTANSERPEYDMILFGAWNPRRTGGSVRNALWCLAVPGTAVSYAYGLRNGGLRAGETLRRVRGVTALGARAYPMPRGACGWFGGCVCPETALSIHGVGPSVGRLSAWNGGSLGRRGLRGAKGWRCMRSGRVSWAVCLSGTALWGGRVIGCWAHPCVSVGCACGTAFWNGRVCWERLSGGAAGMRVRLWGGSAFKGGRQ